MARSSWVAQQTHLVSVLLDRREIDLDLDLVQLGYDGGDWRIADPLFQVYLRGLTPLG